MIEIIIGTVIVLASITIVNFVVAIVTSIKDLLK